jgi:DHA2 family multidrug resistance protein-like MFS transporter
MSLVAALSLVFGLKQIAQDGLAILPVAAIVVGLVVGALFVRRQLRLPDPMIDLRLFRIPSFSASLVVNLLTVFVMVGYFLFVAQYLQLVVALSPLEAGVWSLPSALAFVVGSQLAPRITRVVRPAFVIGAGLAIAAVGLVVLTQVGATAGLAVVVVSSIVISLGLAPVFGLTTELIVGSAPPERAGAASGISETSAELGGALGISILGSIGVAVYRSRVESALPTGIPSDAAVAARDTLGGALGVAAQLPGELGSSVLAVAREAFVSGMQVTSAIAALVAIGIAVLSVVMLRNVTGGTHDAAPSEDGDAAAGERQPAPVAAVPVAADPC